MPDYGFVKAAALSPKVTVANPADNAKQALAAIRLAVQAGAQIAALPELCLSGATCGGLFMQTALLDACEAALLWLAEKTKSSAALIAVGLPVRALGRLYNCAAVLQSGRVLGLVPKQYPESGGQRRFAPYAGEQCSVTLFGQEIPFGRRLFRCGACTVGVELGGDLWAPAPPSTGMALRGANVILHLSARRETVGVNDYRRALIAQQSGRLRCGYVSAGAGSGESSTDAVFAGACLIAENGAVLTESRRFEREGAGVYACLDMELLQAERRGGSFGGTGGDLPCEPCAALPPLREEHISRKYAPQPFVPGNPLPRGERCREILDMQTAALARRLEHTGQKSVILGLSGGLDSTLALLAAVRTADALGWSREAVLCITMPGFGTSAYTRRTVDELAGALSVTLWEIGIRPACELHMQDIGHDPGARDVTYENLQARERTQILMDLANQENALLLGTGTLSELALGWCTYGGDHMSMYAVNAGVPKTLVRHLVEYALDMGDRAMPAIRRVLETPVSPELLPPGPDGAIAQRTEEVLGSYDVFDFYLYYFYRFGFAPAKLLFLAKRAFSEAYPPAQLKAWLIVFLKRFFSQQFKRSCLPDGPAVGSVSLSPREGWAMPSDASARLWVAMAEDLEG